MRPCLLLILLLSFNLSHSQDNIQRLLFDLQFDRASEIYSHPEGNISYQLSELYLDNYLYFLKSLTGGNDRSYQEYKLQADRHTGEIKTLADTGPENLHCLALINIQSAILNLNQEEGWKAVRNYYTAWRMVRSNQERYPGYFPDLMPLGILEIIAGSLPAEYGWIMKWAGIEGTLASGLAKLTTYHAGCAREEQLEATLILALSLYQFDPHDDRAYGLLQRYTREYSGIVLYDYLLALAAMKAGHNDKAILILQQMLQEPEGCSFPYAYLLLGEAKLNRLDRDADTYLLDFLEKYEGKNYIRMAYHKLSWYYFQNNDQLKYEQTRARVQASGRDMVEADRQAYLEAADTAILHPRLLEARLLFDGGYYDRGISLLTGVIHPPLRTVRDSLELNYRLGRLYHKSGDHARAADHYRQVIIKGSGQSYYFIANAMLQMGMMAEEEGRYSEARDHYSSCLSVEKTQYRKSIDQKARAGLDRVSGLMR